MSDQLQVGSTGDAVTKWQYFLYGHKYLKSEVDGNFGPMTADATKDFQRASDIEETGVVDDDTITAAKTLGYAPGDPPYPDFGDTDSAGWPPPPDFKPLSVDEKQQLFGYIEYKPAGIPSDPEAITITNGWSNDNITYVELPCLTKLPGAGNLKKFPFNARIAGQVENLFSVWEAHGLTPRILTWAGSWVPRFVRGSRTTLSSHAWGTAFDINAQWNGYGQQPALMGKKGCVRELAELAYDCGFYWGAYFPKSDGMHLEIARIL